MLAFGFASPPKIRPTAKARNTTKDELKFYAESKEWKVKEVYHLEAVSGKSQVGQSLT